jgi:hypothetical protein
MEVSISNAPMISPPLEVLTLIRSAAKKCLAPAPRNRRSGGDVAFLLSMPWAETPVSCGTRRPS